jgi:hypothetical protein
LRVRRAGVNGNKYQTNYQRGALGRRFHSRK